ncbi:hypothetical protein AAG906_021870 [Vitis piasezkii]
MGGVGKTTLAQLVYNDYIVRGHFDLWAWVSVNAKFDVVKITKIILHSVTWPNDYLLDFDLVQVKLRDALNWKKFCYKGSKIIVTTRNREVALMMRSVLVYELAVLPQDECWAIFSGHAFENQNIDERLPLAAKKLGGLLRYNHRVEEWENILNSNMWDLLSGLRPSLMSTYYHLPFHLKRCFAYCAIFPRGYAFEVNELVFLWMAEGLIQQPEGNSQMEDLGVRYFHELFSISFSNDPVIMSQNLLCTTLITRHFSFTSHVEDVLEKFETFKEANYLRTFLASSTAAPEDDEAVCSSTTRVLDELLAKFKCLRTLSLRGCQIKELPNSIASLMYLRYLNLSLTAIEQLPDLSTLFIYKHCYYTAAGGWLSYLKYQLQEMPQEIGNLIALRILSNFIVSKSSRLHNVGHIWPSCDAILRDTEGLEELLMEWVSDFSGSRNERDEVHLMVSFYGGSKFPSWIGSSSFSNMVDLNLNHCKNCTSLSSLGQLSSLKSLCITGMGGLKRVGAEFYGEISPSVRPFSSMETLIFEDMPEWKNWSFPYMVEKVGAFPCLRQLTLINCPKLIKLPCHPPSLVKLAVCECAELAIPLRRLASVDKLSLTGCCRAHLSTRDGVDLSSLINTFNIQEIPSLTCREDMKQFLEILQHLEIYDCGCLEKLPDELQRLVSLTDMTIEQCPKLVSLPGIFPPELRRLSINCCESLKWLPDGILTYGNSSNSGLLEHLEIRNCPSLACFPTGDVRNSLQQLEIEHCVNLESLPKGMMQDASINPSNTCRLQVLKLYRCSSLRSFPAGKFPSTLKRLEIWDCTQLDGISEKMLQNNTSLECLDFWNYPNLKTLPGCLTPYLKNLHIGNCVNFEFQSHLMQSLSSIQSLCIRRCPGLKSFQEIEDCQNLKSPLSEWNLHRLTSLTGLRIGGLFPDVVSFSAKQGFPLLPTTLTHLSIDRIQNLESLVSLGLQNLTSLKELRFTECLKLHSFLPSEGLPSTVSMLFIRNCPLLSRRYSKNGEDWRDIGHIPCIRMYD